jgi:DNA recombination protein RmuC
MGMIILAFIAGAIFGGLILFLTSRGKAREIVLLKEASAAALLQQKLLHDTVFAQLKLSTDAAFLQQRESYEEALRQQKNSLDARIQDHLTNEAKIKDQFSLVATEILSKNMEAQVKALQTENTHELDKKKQEFNQTFEEVKSHLRTTSEHIQVFEKERGEQYAKIQRQIETMSTQELKLIQETERLKSALTTSQSVRGRWGELVLRNILAQSDLVSGIDFEEQSYAEGNEGNALKPDFVIKLPQSGQHLVIDSKASIFESYLEGETADTEITRQALHRDFAKRLRSRVTELSGKEYQKFVTSSLPYVVLFVPSEAAIRAVFDSDPDLFRWAMDKKVCISSPATIIPLIMLIAHGWNQNKMSEKAAELSAVVAELGNRLETFVSRIGKMRKGIDDASKYWNEALDKSWYGNRSVQKQIDKARELGALLQDSPPLEKLEHQLSLISEKELE